MSIPETHCLNYCSFVVNFETGKHESSNFGLVFKIVLVILDLLINVLSVFTKKATWASLNVSVTLGILPSGHMKSCNP